MNNYQYINTSFKNYKVKVRIHDGVLDGVMNFTDETIEEAHEGLRLMLESGLSELEEEGKLNNSFSLNDEMNIYQENERFRLKITLYMNASHIRGEIKLPKK